MKHKPGSLEESAQQILLGEGTIDVTKVISELQDGAKAINAELQKMEATVIKTSEQLTEPKLESTVREWIGKVRNTIGVAEGDELVESGETTLNSTVEQLEWLKQTAEELKKIS